MKSVGSTLAIVAPWWSQLQAYGVIINYLFGFEIKRNLFTLHDTLT